MLVKLLFAPEKARALIADLVSEITPRHAFDWGTLVRKAQGEGVSGVLFHNVQKHRLDDLLPEELYKSLSGRYYDTLRRNMSVIAALREVLSKFQEAGIFCLALKGIALAELIYPSLAMRGMGDVDLLVEKHDLLLVDDCLSSLGYRSRDCSVRRAVDNPEGYLASIEYGSGYASPLNLHIHWHIVNASVPATAFIRHIDMGRIRERSVMTGVADSCARVLCPEHLIIYLCEHALRVGHSFDRLILICDIFFSLKAYEGDIDWDFIVEESRRFHLSRFVHFSLSIVACFTSIDLPDRFLRQLKPDNISRGERLFLDWQLQNKRVRGSSYFIHLAMNRGLSHKIKFIVRTFFPPSSILLQRRHGRYAPLAPLYYLSRIREVIAQVFRLMPGA